MSTQVYQSQLGNRETMGTGRHMESLDGNTEKLKEVFEIVRKNLTETETVESEDCHLSKAAEGFAAKLVPRYNGPYQVIDFTSPVICKLYTKNSKRNARGMSAIRNTKRQRLITAI